MAVPVLLVLPGRTGKPDTQPGRACKPLATRRGYREQQRPV